MTITTIQNILKRQQTPFYLFDEEGFISNYIALSDAMLKYYPNYQIGYSYKTNYTPYVCNLVKSLGGYAEVVSDMELTLARRLGYKSDNIIYNGPCKGPDMLSHLVDGGILNIDNQHEACEIVKIAQTYPTKQFKVGLRINTDIGAGFISRFGIDSDNNGLQDTINILKSADNIKISGLHMHVSRARYLSAWQKRIDNIISIADRYLDDIPDYIDLGSGMFADMEQYLKNQFDIDVPSYDDYAKVVAGTMAKRYGSYPKKPLLITEPGTTVVSRYFSIFTTVKAIKIIKGRRIAIVDIDIHNAGETCSMMKLPYTVVKSGKGDETGIDCEIAGFTCLEQDIIYKDFPESLRIGDIIQLRNVGGYSIVYKPPFIQPQCAVLCIDSNGNLLKIKREETFDDVFKSYKF